MATITTFPVVRHLRSEPSSHVLQFRGGKLRRSGRGLSFWFLPLTSSVSEVPCDDREIPFLFRGRSADFQDITTQGVITFRVVDAETIARRIDFSVGLADGRHLQQPLEQLAALLTQLAQQHAIAYLAKTAVRDALAVGISEVRTRIHDGLLGDAGLAAMGLEVVTVRVSLLSPTAELEKALQTPMRENIQQQADEATFQRRALAVEKERAISENELENRIELTRREQKLIVQEGLNDQRRAREVAEAQQIATEARTARHRMEAETKAANIREIEQARVHAEEARMDIYRDLPTHVMLGLAAQELAGKLERIDHLNLSPDALGPMLTGLLQAGTRRLEETAEGGDAR